MEEKAALNDLGISETQLKRIIKGRQVRPKVLKKNISNKVFTVGIVSDTHLCSREEKLNELHTFYAIMKKEGIKIVLNAGDMVSGWGIYKGQENEVHTFGAKNQRDYLVKNYPQVEGITTYFISGNHDLSWWNRSGVDVCEEASEKRKDLIYLGQYQGDIELREVKFRLLHPDGGGAYALSYKGQKIAEQMPSGQKPQVLIIGHNHTAVYFFYRNVHILQAGCFEGQTLFLLRKGINPIIGGWTTEIRVGEDNSILSFRPTFIPFM